MRGWRGSRGTGDCAAGGWGRNHDRRILAWRDQNLARRFQISLGTATRRSTHLSMQPHGLSQFARGGSCGMKSLELILRAHGICELVDSDDKVRWASDDDDDFKETFPNEFLSEDEFDDILDWLHDNDVISDREYDKFDNEEWPMNVESLKAGDNGEDLDDWPEDDEDEDD